MNKGVQILLERMDSNPDEFIPDLMGGYPPKWRNTLLAVEMRVNGGKEYKDQLPFLKDAEVTALWDKMRSILGDRFTQEVMRTLLQDEEPRELSSFSHDKRTKAPKRISLSASQIMMAQKMGVSPTDYAKQIAMVNSGEEY